MVAGSRTEESIEEFLPTDKVVVSAEGPECLLPRATFHQREYVERIGGSKQGIVTVGAKANYEYVREPLALVFYGSFQSF